ncbi:MAG: tRNA-dihydrouridine synthase, partial [Methylococcales bacterium]|nr:tRNA-dihydrouridine synthase [Methylococcales bacterium]
TGWDLYSRNAVEIAKIAEESGIAALTLHGRTRACKFNGQAEYETIKKVKQSVSIPIIANGDIDSAEKAKYVLDTTGADAIMIGRAAQGNPWLFNQISQFLKTGKAVEKPTDSAIHNTLLGHLEQLYSFYGNACGVRIARKHIGWYFKQLGCVSQDIKNNINQTMCPTRQLALIDSAFNLLTTDRAA